ncbi:MAG: hypothetical protein ACM3OC_01495 [Deltaproteobacteria bacterium]
MNDIVVRPYRQQDRQAVRQIAWETAYLGRPGEAFFSDKELLQDFLTAYFTDCEPQSSFVAERKGDGVVGYLLGALDERKVGEIGGRKLLPRFLGRFLLRDIFVPKNLMFLGCMMRSCFRGEFRGEDFRDEYPAILHINLREGARGKGAGSRLIETYLGKLRQERIKGVHLATMTPGGTVFFEKQGFSLLSRHERTYFQCVTPEKIMVSIFGKKLI